MRALTFRGERAINYESVDDPQICDPTDAIVKVERSAICGSDLHVYHGRERGLDLGTVMGHEFVGRVIAVGSDVSGVATGDRVVSPFTTNCGNCFYCRSGLTARCERGQLFGWVEGGRGLHGAQAEAVRVPLADATLVRIPDDVAIDLALLLGDVLPTGWYCAARSEVGPGQSCAVVGCGPVGLMAIAAARERGAMRVFAVDIVPARLEFAERFGATPIDASQTDAARQVRAATNGRGVDAVLEAVGSERAHRNAYDLVRPGGTISVVGVHNEERFAFTPTELYDRNLTYRVGRCPARALIDEVLGVARSARYPFEEIFTHRMPLAAGAEAYRVFDEKRDGCVKVSLGD